MKQFYCFFALLILFLSGHSEANYVYHEASTNTIGLTALQFRDRMVPNRTQSVKIGFKIEWEGYWNQARIYYTTDGTNPSGAFGVGAGTTQVLTTTWDHKFGSPMVDAVFGTIPALPTGTTVKYIVSAWHSGGGDEIFGNGCGNCAIEKRPASSATIFSYTVKPLLFYINDGVQTGDVYTTAVGNDANDGLSPSTPKLTVSNLLTAYQLIGSDTVYIDRGTYNQSFLIEGSSATSSQNDQGSLKTASPFAANYVVFKGAGNTHSVFNGAAGSRFNVHIKRARYIWLEAMGFVMSETSADSSYNILKDYGNSSVIKNCKLDLTSASPTAGINILIRCVRNTNLSGSNSLIANNIMTNSNNSTTAAGIQAWGDVDSCRFEGNTISMTGSTGKGVLFSGRYNTLNEATGSASGNNYWPVEDTVIRNTITSNYVGVYCVSQDGYELINYRIESNNISINNTNLPSSGIYLDNCGDKPGSEKPITIYKNRLMGGGAGIYIFDRGEYVKIHNNYICSRFGLYSNDYIGSGTDKDNEFLHNSVYTTGSCLYFDNQSQDDWDIRNNILYTTTNNTTAACINIVSYGLNDMEACNGNLFYAPNLAYVCRANSTNYTFATWKTLNYTYAAGNNDINSLAGIAPNFQAKDSNCDLDLLPDLTMWTTGFPNHGNSLISNSSFVLGGGASSVSSDIKSIPTRSYWTIGAFEAGSTTLLPVQLMAFNARLVGQRVLLDWQTATELNSDRFEVEKSKDGTSGWTLVSNVPGRGNSIVRSDYQTTDYRPYAGVSYYRLKQIDRDGQSVYSQTRKIINDTRIISLYPNPAKDIAVVGGLDKNRSNMIHLLDITGKLLAEHFVTESQFRFDLSKLPPGVYHVVVNGIEHFQLLKK
jgi:hypothetical protein